MSDSKKKRLSMLDTLAAASPPAPSSLIKTNRPLRAARDAVDSHKVWDLDPAQIIDDRVVDRLDHNDIADLIDSIETTGQTVPILVRRNPSDPDTYQLVYGRRRLEAIRASKTVNTVRALIANMDEDAAVQAQISENMARRDLSFIEKALFAFELVESGFGNQSRVAEVLTVTKSSVSMALAIVNVIGPDLIRAIGPAHGVGRPRWEALAKGIEITPLSRDDLLETVSRAYAAALVELTQTLGAAEPVDPSVVAFEHAIAQVTQGQGADAPPKAAPRASAPAGRSYAVTAGGQAAGKISRTSKGVRVDLDKGPFAQWVEEHGQSIIQELHARWQQRGEDI